MRLQHGFFRASVLPVSPLFFLSALWIDNNLVENSIRPFVIGRKNYLFCDPVAGANASANLYSLIETAKANGIEPYAYIKTVFTELPNAGTVEDVEDLLPIAETLEQCQAE